MPGRMVTTAASEPVALPATGATPPAPLTAAASSADPAMAAAGLAKRIKSPRTVLAGCLITGGEAAVAPTLTDELHQKQAACARCTRRRPARHPARTVSLAADRRSRDEAQARPARDLQPGPGHRPRPAGHHGRGRPDEGTAGRDHSGQGLRTAEETSAPVP